MACGMEILTSIFASAVAEIGRCFCLCICPKIKSTARFNRNLRDLQKEENKLVDLKKEVEKQLESAEKFERSPTTEVKNWLTKVGEFVDKVKSVREAATVNDNSPCGCHCHCSQRVRLGSKVGRLLKEVKTLLKDGNFPDGTVSVVDDSAKPVEYIPGPSIEYQTTASRNLQELMKKLEDDNVQRIGVWGMGGVGKTTLVKNLNNKLSRGSPEQPFSIVIWITVSKEVDLERVRREIADRLNLEIKAGESIERTARRLHRRLEKEKFLLILDDVWDNIDLVTLGIPEPIIQSGSKILLTTRFADVCHRMSVGVEVKVDTLGDVEAWQLFSEKAGEIASLEHIEPTARKVARECCGLPLALVTVGTSMRGKKMVELWAHALTELQRSAPSIHGVEKEVYNPLKWSYDSLEGQTIKFCLLYCALYPEDFSIEVSELLQCWLAEGLIDDKQNFEEFVNNGVFVIETLKDACLLEDGSEVGTVKMHDVVRDVATWIASSTEENDSRSLVRSGIGLTEIQEVDLSEDSVKRVSFMNNRISRLTSSKAERCSKASTLLLQGNPIVEVPEMFLQRFLALKVLNVSRTGIKSLPPLLRLGELRAFLLQHCSNLRELPPLGVLIRLQVLNLSGTSIEELPKEMENLINLRQVDLSHTRCLRSIQAGIVSKWTRLEVLDMTSSLFVWYISAREGRAFFEELLPLEQLSCVSLVLGDFSCLDPEYLMNRIGRMKRFHFTFKQNTSVFVITSRNHEKGRVTLNWSRTETWNPERMMGWLLINATSLVWNADQYQLNDNNICDDLNNIIQCLLSVKSVGTRSFDCFAALKSLTINDICRYGSLPVAGNDVPDLLPNLEELSLQSITSMQSISKLVDGLGLKLKKLKTLLVLWCPNMKYLFTGENFRHQMLNLEQISVSFCDKLEMLFDYNLVLQNLRILKLNRLKELKDLCIRGEPWPCLEKVYVSECSGLRRLPLNIGNANNIQEIRGEPQWWSGLIWDEEETKSEETKSRLQQYYNTTE